MPMRAAVKPEGALGTVGGRIDGSFRHRFEQMRVRDENSAGLLA